MSSALALGTVAALGWGALALTLTQAGRQAGTWTTTFWTGLVSLLITGLAAAATGPPGGDLADWSLVALAGVAYTANMVFYLMAIRGGQVSLITPIVGCDGAFAALLAVAAGETLGLGTSFGLAAMVFALVLVTSVGASNQEDVLSTHGGPPEHRSTGATVTLALLTAFLFGLVFFLSGKASDVNPLWIVAGVRVVPTAIAFVVCLRTQAFKPPAAARAVLLISGALDAVAFVCFVAAAQSSLAIAAVAASQYAALAAIGGTVVFGESLRPRQWIGVALLVSAAAVIGAGG